LQSQHYLRAQIVSIITSHEFYNPEQETVHVCYVVTYADEQGKVGESAYYTDQHEDAPTIGQVFYI